MHIIVILAFACVFWQAEEPVRWLLIRPDDIVLTLAAVASLPAVAVLGSWWVARRGLRQINGPHADFDAAHEFHHKATFMLRVVLLGMFAGLVFLTPWTGWLAWGQVTPILQVFGDLVALIPFFVSITIIWIVTYRLDNLLRDSAALSEKDLRDEKPPWSIAAFLDFHLRHYVLVVAAPMTIILAAAAMTRGYEGALRDLAGGWVLAPEFALGAVAAGVFVVAPVLLRRIWRTEPMEPGPLRDRLEQLCDRINLRCRDILVWHSDGMMINAAVMGLFPGVRYVLLSDGLLETMSERQVEAVFGHEAGHIRLHHIQHFLLFAFVAWLIVAGLMELLGVGALTFEVSGRKAALFIQGFGIVATAIVWGVGFGWLSRRFERQADLFGARCVTPNGGDECARPCSVHLESPKGPLVGRVCATGAAIFASALDRVALLNGIPLEEFSWRHSSIGSRIRFLASLAGDPARAVSFERWLKRVKLILIALSLIGVASLWIYLTINPQPAILRLHATL